MQELIEKLKSKFNLSDDQCHGVLQTVVSFVKEKFPMAAGVMDNLLPGDKAAEHTTDTDVAQAVAGGAEKLKGF